MSQIFEVANDDGILQRHKKENRDLQNEITRLKHSVSKTDKKAKKDLQTTIAKLENDLEQRHIQELENFRSLKIDENVDVTITNGDCSKENDEQSNGLVQKSTRAQKRREKKETEAKTRQIALEQSATETYSSNRAVEKRTFKPILAKRNLRLFEISADGDCLYNAISHQLILRNHKHSVRQLREMTSSTIKSHKEDFLPFLLHHENDGDNIINPEGDDLLENYCNKVANTNAWGGHVELKALSLALNKRIEILQADGAPISVGEELDNDSNNALVITFHKHAYLLGEHYNSTAPLSSEDKNSSDDGEQ